MPTKLILDTDIGTDVDDAWALALCLASRSIDLVGVTLVHADLETRAKIALKMLTLAGRTDIPVYKGLSQPLTGGAAVYWEGHEGTETDFSDIAGLVASEGAVEFILDTLEANPGEVVVSSIGPMTNVGEAIRRAPGTMKKAAKLVIMGTTYNGEGADVAEREHNGGVDPDATRLVLESGIPATVVGANVTLKVTTKRADLAQLRASALGRYLAAMTEQYYRVIGREFSHMHDPLAVSTLIDPAVVATRRMSARVLADGRVAFTSSPDGPLEVAVDVDVARFEQLLLSNISGFVV